MIWSSWSAYKFTQHVRFLSANTGYLPKCQVVCYAGFSWFLEEFFWIVKFAKQFIFCQAVVRDGTIEQVSKLPNPIFTLVTPAHTSNPRRWINPFKCCTKNDGRKMVCWKWNNLRGGTFTKLTNFAVRHFRLMMEKIQQTRRKLNI